MWSDYFKIFTFAFTSDPLSKNRSAYLSGAGTPQPDALPDIRAGQDGFNSGSNSAVQLRDTNDFIDLSTVTNRLHRYKEYERLRNMAEIDMAMTVFADEACLAGATKVATPHGFRTLRDLAEDEKERFLVYCYDFEKRDYTLGWAHNPRKTKKALTVKVLLDDSNSFICTPDHRILLKNGEWKQAGDLKRGDELMPFYRLPARQSLTKVKHHQYPRIWTHEKGWINERQFVDDWTTGKTSEQYLTINTYCRMLAEGLSPSKITELTGNDIRTINDRLQKVGFSNKEIKCLGHKRDRRIVVGKYTHQEIDVYDLTVEEHHNFATDWGIVHNCQRDDDGYVFQVKCENQEIKEELDFLFFHRRMLNFDQKKLWTMAKQLFVMGDYFWELVVDAENPKAGIQNLVPLPVDSMYRIETTKGRLVEFQQSKEGPDYQSIARVDPVNATDNDLQSATAIRFAPEQITHIRIGDDRKTFYPYGVSLMETARGPAHQLRIMEDAMVVYRLSRAPERRVFYIDTHQLPPFKAEAFIERMKDQFKKKKVPNGRGTQPGASSVEEKWHAPAADEDYWIPIRPNSNTRVETLPGASNLGEVDDTIYFRNKLFTALNFPKNYFNNEDAQATKISLSAQDVKFARMIERLQSHIEDGIWEICDRHLRLLGYPEEAYEDLQIKLTPPSDWRELTRAEVLSMRLNNASTIKGSQLMSDYDILTQMMKHSDEEAKQMLARLKIQKLEDLKLQILAQNPALLGVGLPGPNETEVGAEAGGPNPMLGSDPAMSPGQNPDQMNPAMDQMSPGQNPDQMNPAMDQMNPGQNMKKYMKSDDQFMLPDPSMDDIQKFDLEIKDFAQEMDEEEIDFSEID